MSSETEAAPQAPQVPHAPRQETSGGEAIDLLRARIDTDDADIISALRLRLQASREIQRIRTGEGGSTVDAGREDGIRNRYVEAFGPGGDGVATAILQLCRGQWPR